EQNNGSVGEESEYHEALICEGYDHEMPLADHVPNLDEFGNGNEDEPKSSKQSRGGTVRSEQNKKRKRSGKFVVKYNIFGVPVGEEAIELSTYIGVLTRISIPILYNDWRRVPDDTKERLLESIKVYFVVHPRRKKQVLQAIRAAFRNFKYTIMRNYVLPFVNDCKRLFKPPAWYSTIDKESWVKFVKKRL
ncbi:hypothetical protein CISIN_1g043539mg, partial [Citrus sinensis]